MKRLLITMYDGFNASEMVSLAHAVNSINESTPVLTDDSGFVLLVDESELRLMQENLQPLVEDKTICKVEVVGDPHKILF